MSSRLGGLRARAPGRPGETSSRLDGLPGSWFARGTRRHPRDGELPQAPGTSHAKQCHPEGAKRPTLAPRRGERPALPGTARHRSCREEPAARRCETAGQVCSAAAVQVGICSWIARQRCRAEADPSLPLRRGRGATARDDILGGNLGATAWDGPKWAPSRPTLVAWQRRVPVGRLSGGDPLLKADQRLLADLKKPLLAAIQVHDEIEHRSEYEDQCDQRDHAPLVVHAVAEPEDEHA